MTMQQRERIHENLWRVDRSERSSSCRFTPRRDLPSIVMKFVSTDSHLLGGAPAADQQYFLDRC